MGKGALRYAVCVPVQVLRKHPLTVSLRETPLPLPGGEETLPRRPHPI